MTFISLEFMPERPFLEQWGCGRPASVKWFTLQAQTCSWAPVTEGNEETPGLARTRGLTVATMQRGLGHLVGYWALRSHQPLVWETREGRGNGVSSGLELPPALAK